jgi:isopenicillin N synthase-like dioxygenase
MMDWTITDPNPWPMLHGTFSGTLREYHPEADTIGAAVLDVTAGTFNLPLRGGL